MNLSTDLLAFLRKQLMMTGAGQAAVALAKAGEGNRTLVTKVV